MGERVEQTGEANQLKQNAWGDDDRRISGGKKASFNGARLMEKQGRKDDAQLINDSSPVINKEKEIAAAKRL